MGGRPRIEEHTRPQRRAPCSQGGLVARCDFREERPPTPQRIGREALGGEERSPGLGMGGPDPELHGCAVAALRPPPSIRKEGWGQREPEGNIPQSSSIGAAAFVTSWFKKGSNVP